MNNGKVIMVICVNVQMECDDKEYVFDIQKCFFITFYGIFIMFYVILTTNIMRKQ